MDYENILSKKVQDLQFSGIRKFFDIAASYDDVISLSVGEPDFKTPWAIRKEAIKCRIEFIGLKTTLYKAG